VVGALVLLRFVDNRSKREETGLNVSEAVRFTAKR